MIKYILTTDMTHIHKDFKEGFIFNKLNVKDVLKYKIQIEYKGQLYWIIDEFLKPIKFDYLSMCAEKL